MSDQIPIVFLPSGISRVSPNGLDASDCQDEEILYRRSDNNGKSTMLNEKFPAISPDTEMLCLDRADESSLQDVFIDGGHKARAEYFQDENQMHQEKLTSTTAEPNMNTANAKTLKTYQSHVRVFKDWLKSEALPDEFEYCSVEELSSWLKKFYVDGRRKDGQQWKPSSLKIFRFAINQHLNNEPFNRSMSITRDKQFREANMVISERQKELVQLGEDATGTRESKESARPLACDDVHQLFERGVIGVANPKALHRYVFMIMGINFGVTTRLALHLLKPSMIQFKVDENSGLVHAQYDPKADKTSLNKTINKPKKKMFGIPGNSMCPVAALKLYIQKRNPECTEAFFHTPNRHYKETGVWYTPQATGKNTLGRLMKDITNEGKLSFPYTNHSLRYTPPYVFSPTYPNTLPGYIINGGKTSAPNGSELHKELRPFCSDARSFQLHDIKAKAERDKPMVTSGKFGLYRDKNYGVHPSVVRPAGNIPSLYPPEKRSRLMDSTSTSVSNGEIHSEAVLPIRTGQLIPETHSKTCNTARKIRAHNVLCVSKEWEMEDIMKAINNGDAIILTSQDLLDSKNPENTNITNKTCEKQHGNQHGNVRGSSDQGKQEHSNVQHGSSDQGKQEHSNVLGSSDQAEQEHSNVQHGSSDQGKQELIYSNSSSPKLFKPASPKMLARPSRKQLEPKRIRPDELAVDGDELQVDAAYDDALTSIQLNLTAIEQLQRVHQPSTQTLEELDKIRKLLDAVVHQNNHASS